MILRTLALALAATTLAAPPAQARSTVLVDQADPAGDVNIFDGGGTKPTTGQRRSIDLERFVVSRTNGGVRFTFRIARITAARSFDQVVEAQLQKPGRGGFTFDVLADPQHKNGTAYLGGTLCLTDVTTSRRTGTVRVDVPDKCLPKDAGVLRVSTYTQERNGSGPGFSEDTMRVRGRIRLT